MTDSMLPSGAVLGAPSPSRQPLLAVTAVVVTRGPTRYLATTLAALAAQTRPPERVVVVDVAPLPGSRTRPQDAPADVASAASPVRLHLPGAQSFGHAVDRVLGELDAAAGSSAPGAAPTAASSDAALSDAALSDAGPSARPRAWLWLLHDDSAPAPDALDVLVRAVDGSPSVAVAGVKQRTWTEPERLLEVGLRTSRSGRRMTGVEDAEVDQGQHDGREDVLGVGIAGALVRRDVWDALGGTDPALGCFGDGLELSRRARLAGHRVIVVPRAVVRHAQASYHGLRGGAPGDLDGAVEVDADGDGVPDTADARRSFAARRRSLLHLRLVSAPVVLVPVVAVLAVLVGVLRSLGRVASKEPGLAVAELVAPFATLARPRAVLRARTRLRTTRRLPRRALRPLQATGREVWAEWRDRRLARAESRKVGLAASELELGELAQLATARRVGLGVLVTMLAAVTALGLGPVVARVVGGAHLVGPALVPSAARLGELWAAVTSGWVAGGLGAPGPADALLAALLPGTVVVGGSSATAVAVLVLGSLVLAGAGAWFAAGAATRSVVLRLWAALAWAAAPTLLTGLGDGRIGAVLAHVALPWVALGLARAIGVQRVDSVVSGLVTARRWADDAPTDDLTADIDDGQRGEPAVRGISAGDRAFPDLVTGGPARLDAAGQDVAGRDAVVRDGTDRDTSVAASAESLLARAEHLAGPELRVGAPLPTGSIAAAAGAAIAFAVVVAGAPALLLPGVVVLLVVAACAPRARKRIVLVPVPAIALLGPTLAEAAARGRDGLRLLVADPGPALDSSPADRLHQLLGIPTTGGDLLPAALPESVRTLGPAALGAVVLVLALLALLRGAPVARAVRAGWFAAAAGLAVAAVSGTVAVAVDEGSTVHGWPGSGLSLAGAGLLAAGLVGADGLTTRLARSTFGWRQPATVLLALVAGLVPVATLGAWSWQARTGDAVGLTTLDRRVVPAVGQQAQGAPTSARVLALEPAAGGVLTWQLLGGDGPQLVDTAAAVTTRTLHGALGSPSVVAPDAATAEVDGIVARLGAGTSGEVADGLGALGVADVLVPPAGAGTDAAGRSQLVGRLDGTSGLGRITENEAGIIWRVQPAETAAGAAAGTVTVAWARLVSDDGTTPVAVAASGRAVQSAVPAGPAGRLLVLAERSDPGWTATLDGTPLRAVDDGWRQAFAVGDAGGELVVRYDDAGRLPWLVVQAAVALLTVLLAVPVRRRRAGRR